MNRMSMEESMLKENWGDGPWQNEPDRDEWIDEATGYHCIVKRTMLTGAWCGYVGVPKGHPCNGKDYNDVDVEVHWGLTYAQECAGNPGEGVCHKPEEGEDHVWWLGFDCNHCYDIAPAMEARMRMISPELDGWKGGFPDVTYKTLEFVKAECTSLTSQLKAMEAK